MCDGHLAATAPIAEHRGDLLRTQKRQPLEQGSAMRKPTKRNGVKNRLLARGVSNNRRYQVAPNNVTCWRLVGHFGRNCSCST